MKREEKIRLLEQKRRQAQKKDERKIIRLSDPDYDKKTTEYSGSYRDSGISRVFASRDPQAASTHYTINGKVRKIIDESKEGYWQNGEYVAQKKDYDTSQYVT